MTYLLQSIHKIFLDSSDLPINTYKYMFSYMFSLIILTGDRESFLIYLGVSVTSGVLSILLLATLKLLWKRHKHRSNMSHTRNLSKTYSEDTSEAEADIDLTNLTQPSSVTILSSPEHHIQHHHHSPAEVNINC